VTGREGVAESKRGRRKVEARAGETAAGRTAETETGRSTTRTVSAASPNSTYRIRTIQGLNGSPK